MKIVSLCLSTIFFLNMGWSQPILKQPMTAPSIWNSSPPKSSSSSAAAAKVSTISEEPVLSSAAASLRLRQEEKITDFVKLWNQSSTLSQAIEQFAVSKEDKFFLQQVLKKEKMNNSKPARIEYAASKNKMILNLAEGKKTFWILAREPSFVLYDEKEVFVFHSDSLIRNFFPEYKDQFKTMPNQKKKKKSTASWMSFWLPFVYAQTTTTTTSTTTNNNTIPKTFSDLHNEQIEKQQAVFKKVAKKQKTFTQNLLWFIGLGAGLSLFATTVTAGAHIVNEHSGSKGHLKLREDVDKLKDIYPEIDNGIFNGDSIEIKSFSCATILNKNAPVRKLRYQFRDIDNGEEKNRVEIDLDLADTPSLKDDIIKGEKPDLGKKIEILDRCCQNIPCDKWLSERIASIQKDSSDGESMKSVDDFVEEKIKKAKGSIGTK